MAIDDGNTRPVDDVEPLVGAFVKVVGATSSPPTANTMTAAYDLAFDADRRKPGRKLSWSLLMVFSSQWQAQAERVNGRRFTWQRISRETSHAWHPRMQPPKAVTISSKEAMTNCHVVARAKTIALANTTTTLPAEVIAADCKTDRCYLSVRRRIVLTEQTWLASIACAKLTSGQHLDHPLPLSLSWARYAEVLPPFQHRCNAGSLLRHRSGSPYPDHHLPIVPTDPTRTQRDGMQRHRALSFG